MANPAPRSAADVLIELLGKVPDVATLELLLEPEHLRALLNAQGVPDDEIRRALTNRGRAPGELLLEVLAREPDTRVLLDLLGNPQPREKAPDPPARRAGDALTSGPSARSKGAVIALVGLLLAAPSGWYLFVRLDVLHAYGLIRFFPGAYALLASALLLGLFLVWTGARTLVRGTL